MIIRCNSKLNPIGVDFKPFFGWEITDECGNFQKSYRIKVYDINNEICWDSGRVESDESVYVYYKGKELKSHTKYYWNVVVETDEGTYASEMQSFVTAISEADWKAKWITKKTYSAPVFKKTFSYQKAYGDAFVSVCGLGFFELKINSKKVGEDYFVPNRTDYDSVIYENLQYRFDGETAKTVNYLTYDVTDLLVDGENQIEMQLGNGFYNQNIRAVEGIFKYDDIKMILQLSMLDTLVVSDESWEVYESSLKVNELFKGEQYDFTAECCYVGNAEPATSPSGEFSPQDAPADRVMKTQEPILIGDNIYDCQEVMTGFAKILCKGKKKSRIVIRYAEKIDETGKLDFSSTVGYTELDNNQIQEDTFILSGDGVEELTPKFIWHGFRYFEIIKGDAEIVDVKAMYIYTAVEDNGSFLCSDELYNSIHRIFENAQKGNLHCAIPTDCPHRERLGYTGDGQNSSYSIMFNFKAYHFYKKWIKDICDAQNKETGFVPHTAPFNGGGGGVGWGSACVIVPWNLYLHYGDKSVLENTVDTMSAWIEYLMKKRNEKGLIDKEEEGSWCLGDWVLPYDGDWSGPISLDIPNELVNTCFFIICIRIYKKILNILKIDKYDYTDELEQAKKSINQQFFHGFYSSGKQGCDVFPMYCEIVEESHRKALTEKIINDIKHNAFHTDTGLFGTKYLFEVLDKTGNSEIVARILSQVDYPSFGYMVKNNATAVWETWEGSGSQNHIGLSAADSWFYTSLAGIKNTDSGGFKNFVINPFYYQNLDFVKAEYTTIYGKIKVQWSRAKNNITLSVEIPFNSSATIYIDGCEKKLQRGKYQFVINTF